MPGSVYVDTSVVGRILLGEPGHLEAAEALEYFDAHVSSRLLRVELRRLARRRRLNEAEADIWLRSIDMAPIVDEILDLAARIEPDGVATLDAIHLATALQLADGGNVDAVFTFDDTLAAGARHHGLAVLPPPA